MSKTKKRLKESVISVGSGASAGFVEVCMMHPLDLVKTRLQLQRKRTTAISTDPNYYSGIADCIKKMYKNEGLPSFWKGILPPILVDTPRRAIKFFTFDEYKKIFMYGESKATPITYALAGACAGATESVLVNPFEVVKITLQSNRAKMKEVPSAFTVAKQIFTKDGLGTGGLFKGLTATIMRGALFNICYFGFYHSVNDFILVHFHRKAIFFEKFLLGFIAGTLASVVNIPFDVAKSRIQGPQPEPGRVKYRTCWKTLNMVYKEEGWQALYKGLAPKILRLGPGGAIMLLVNEYVAKFLTEYFQ